MPSPGIPGLSLGLEDGYGDGGSPERGEQRLSGQTKTTLWALQRIITALQPPGQLDIASSSLPTRPTTPRRATTDPSLPPAPTPISPGETLPTLSSQSQIQADIHTSQSTESSVPSALGSPPAIPPTVHRLLQARLHKLAVSHMLSHPSYALSRPLVSRVAFQLEKQGAGKLARSLRSAIQSIEVPPLTATSRLPPNHWQYRPIPLPPSQVQRKHPLSSAVVVDPRLTAYWNTHLSASLRQPASSAGQAGGMSAGPRKVPRPGPGLHQLRDLLNKICKLEKHNGFVPDAVTANIILGCWLRCIAGGENGRTHGLSPHRGWGWRLVRTVDGWRVGWKVRSRSIMGEAELRGMFDIVAKVMDTSTTASSPARPAVEYERHVRPFCQMMVRALRQQGDHAGVHRVLEWKVDIKARLEDVTRMRGDPDRMDSSAAELL